jgi:aminocarboxymuconate-semialdehyde decarboxylase
MRKIDIFTHIIPPRYGKRAAVVWRGLPPDSGVDIFLHIVPPESREYNALSDLDQRFRDLERLEDYSQVLTLATPPVADLGAPETNRQLARLANEEMAELVREYPEVFVAFAASLPHTSPDDDLAELERAIGDLGAAGIQLHTNVRGVALDDEAFVPVFEKMNEIGKPIWLHPERSPLRSDYPNEAASKYDIFWSLGWPYETSVAMARLVFSGRLEQFPDLKIITHHAGALTAPLSARLASPLYMPSDHELSREPLDYFRSFYADTATFGASHAVRCSLEFFGVEHMLFGTDSPAGGLATDTMTRGEGAIRDAIRDVELLDLPQRELELIFHGNAARLLGLDEA